MADNVTLKEMTGGEVVAADDIAGIKYQRMKLTLGADGVDDGDVSTANPIPVTLLAGFVPDGYDYISLGYTGSDLTTVVYKTGGVAGTTIATLTLVYSESILQSITRT
jgi:hypothetical protein